MHGDVIHDINLVHPTPWEWRKDGGGRHHFAFAYGLLSAGFNPYSWNLRGGATDRQVKYMIVDKSRDRENVVASNTTQGINFRKTSKVSQTFSGKREQERCC